MSLPARAPLSWVLTTSMARPASRSSSSSPTQRIGPEAGGQGAGQLLADELVGFLLIAAALGVADDDPGRQAAEHRGGDLAGIRPALLVVNVLCPDEDVLAGEGVLDGGQADVWRANDSRDARLLRSGGDGRGKLSGVRGGGVHLPVGSDNHRSHSREF